MHKVSIKYVYLHRNKICPIKNKKRKRSYGISVSKTQGGHCRFSKTKDSSLQGCWKAVEKEVAQKRKDGREIDCEIYKNLLYQLEIRKVFLDSKLSLKN